MLAPMQDQLAAVVQMCAGPDPAVTLARAAELTAEALTRGADLVVLPENFWGIAPAGFDRGPWAVDLTGDPAAQPVLAAQHALSAATDALIVLGGLPERPAERDGADPPASASTPSRCSTAAGSSPPTARSTDSTRPSRTAPASPSRPPSPPATRPTLLAAPRAVLGLSICYDLRFPELYRALAAAGAEVLLVPSAFTLLTGIDHWIPLLRARAIENQCYVLAPAQHGAHGHGRHSFGHSVIIDPWGTIIAEASRGDGVALAPLRADLLDRVRADLPTHSHRRLAGETSVDRRTLPAEPAA
jgi:predicted amidohydrolase